MCNAELNVTVSTVYRPAPGEAPGELGPNEFTAGSRLSLNCLVHGNSDELSYKWTVSENPSTSGCDNNGCAIDLSSTTSSLAVGKPPLYSYYSGVYTCTVSEAGRSDSGNSFGFNITVVGKHVHNNHCNMIICNNTLGEGLYDYKRGSPIDKNGLIISSDDGLVFDCVSNSSRSGIASITAPDGVSLSGRAVYPYNRPGLVRFRTQNNSPFPATDQGIYSCNIPDSNGHSISLNVGLYPPGFNGELTSTVMVSNLSLSTQRVPPSHL